MKFRQRQILLGIAFCLALVFLLAQFRTPVTPQDRAAVQGRPLRHQPPHDGGQGGADHGRPNNRSLTPSLSIAIAAGPNGPSKQQIAHGYSSKRHNRSGDDALKRSRVGTLELVSRRQGAGASLVGDCPQVLGPVDVVETQTFQKVGGKPDLFVFSAFLDEPQNVVRLVAIGEGSYAVGIFCQLWYRQRPVEEKQGADKRQGAVPEMRVVPGTFAALPEGHGLRYTAAYITCSLPSLPKHERPYAVSVTRTDCRQAAGEAQAEVAPDNVVQVLAPATSTPLRNFTVCITALNYRYSKAYELVEMIELNRILGAQLFTFYVHSVGDNVEKVLAWYERQGLVKLVDWKLPMNVDHWPQDPQAPSEIHYFGQLASHNDCLNRHRGASRYLVYEDLDEFIIPKRHYNWTRMMEQLEIESSSSAYIFRCQFFRKEWGSNTEQFPGHELAAKFRSVVLSTVQREPNLFSYTQRAKYFIKPENIDIVGIHNIWSYRGPPKIHQVPQEVAVMHHYRSWERPEEASRGVRDTSMYAYREDLLARLQDVWSHFPDLPLDIDIATYGRV